MLGAMVFNRDPMFRGKDNFDQLVKIAKVTTTFFITIF